MLSEGLKYRWFLDRELHDKQPPHYFHAKPWREQLRPQMKHPLEEPTELEQQRAVGLLSVRPDHLVTAPDYLLNLPYPTPAELPDPNAVLSRYGAYEVSHQHNNFVHLLRRAKLRATDLFERMRNERWEYKEVGEHDFLISLEPVRRPLKDVLEYLEEMDFQFSRFLNLISPEMIAYLINETNRAWIALDMVESHMNEVRENWTSQKYDRTVRIPYRHVQHRPIRVKPERVEMKHYTERSIPEGYHNRLRDYWLTGNEIYNDARAEFARTYERVMKKIGFMREEQQYFYESALRRLKAKVNKELKRALRDTRPHNLDESTSQGRWYYAIGNWKNAIDVLNSHREELERLNNEIIQEIKAQPPVFRT